jgi:hypothetical protein
MVWLLITQINADKEYSIRGLVSYLLSSALLTIKFVPCREEFCSGNLRLSASSEVSLCPLFEVLTLTVDSDFGFLCVSVPPWWMFLFWLRLCRAVQICG